MDILQLAKREVFREPSETDIGIVQLSAQAQDRHGEYVGMVESEGQWFVTGRLDLDWTTLFSLPRHVDAGWKESRRLLERALKRVVR